MEKEQPQPQPHLSISAHVVVQLGRELVTDKEQSILELVKNSYDADADECEIIIEPDWSVCPKLNTDIYYKLFPERLVLESDTPAIRKQKEKLSIQEEVGRIVIKDDGDGMTEDVIESSWLRISYSSKRAESNAAKQRTKKQRVPVGDKGLGRLATMKLGKIIRLDTSVQGEAKKKGVWFSWDDFTVDVKLEDVQVNVVPPKQQLPAEDKGTIISIIGLEDVDEWRKNVAISKTLVSKFSDLVSPFLENKDFLISICSGGQTYEIKSLKEDVLDLCASSFHWKWDGSILFIDSKINEFFFTGRAQNNEIAVFNKIFKNKKLREEFCNKLKKSNKFKGFDLEFQKSPGFLSIKCNDFIGEDLPNAKHFPGSKDPGAFSADIYDFNFNRLGTDKISAVGTSVEFLKASNINIFRDGFKIRTESDWLKLSENQTGGGSFYGLRPANTIGLVSISNEHNSKLIEKSDRESFVDNSEFRGFMQLSIKARDRINMVREEIRREYTNFINSEFDQTSLSMSKTGNSDETKKTYEELSSALTSVSNTVETLKKTTSGKQVDVSSIVKQIEVELHGVSEKHNKYKKSIEYTLGTEELNLRLMEAAAVGLSARSMSHELHQYVRQFKESVTQLKSENKKLKNNTIKNILISINTTLNELAKMISSLDPMLPGARSIKEKIDIHQTLENYVNDRKDYANKKGVVVEIKQGNSKNLVIKFNMSRLFQVFENLFQNSVYWLTVYKRTKFPDPKITVTFNDDGFIWEDNGPGINQFFEERLFEPYITDKPAGDGQGLGLYISNVFLSSERCSIWLGDEKNALGRRYRFHVDVSPAKAIKKQGGLF